MYCVVLTPRLLFQSQYVDKNLDHIKVPKLKPKTHFQEYICQTGFNITKNGEEITKIEKSDLQRIIKGKFTMLS